MRCDPRVPFLYLDDGYPESRDYDDNYVPVASRLSRGVLRRLLAWCGEVAFGNGHRPVRWCREDPRAA